MNKKLILMFFCVLLLVGTVSALTLNSKNFDRSIGDYGKYEIKNLFGTSLKDIELTDNTESCFLNECYAIKTIKLYKKDTLVDDQRFYLDVGEKWELTTIRDYNFQIKTGDREKIVDDYNQVAIEYLKNGTIIYESQKVGSHIETTPIWETLDITKEYDIGIYTVRLNGILKPNQVVDWQVKVNGIWTEEWSIWGSGTNSTEAHGVTLSSTASHVQGYGMLFTMGSTGYNIASLKTAPGCLSQWAQLYHSNETLIQNVSITSNVAIFEPVWLDANVAYRVESSGTTGGNPRKYAAGSYPVAGTNLEWTTGSAVFGPGNDSSWNNIESINLSIYSLLNFISPADNFGSSNALVTFTCDVNVSGATATNLSLLTNITGTWGHTNDTTGLSTADEIDDWENTFSEGAYLWGCEACDSDGNCGYTTANRTINVDLSVPVITIVSPNETFSLLNSTDIRQLNVTVTDATLDKCWYSYGGVNTTYTCASGVQQNETFTQQYGNYNITVWANDTSVNNGSAISLWDFFVFENTTYFNTSSYETSSQDFTINLDVDSSDWDSVAAILFHNGTGYVGTKSGTGDNLNFTKNIQIPTITSEDNKQFLWEISLTNSTGTTKVNTTIANHTTNFTTLALCNATFITKYINFTFRDEQNSTAITAGVPSATFVYYLGDGTVNKTLSFINVTENAEYDFCFFPNNTGMTTSYSLQYISVGYPQRIVEEIVSLTSTITNKILYLLETADGIYVTFQVINQAEQPISGAAANATRLIGGVETVVGDGTTDAAGAITFWLNPDFLHTLIFRKTGFDNFVTSLFPTQSSYTINMGGSSAATTQSDYGKGISYSITPTDALLTNGTYYNFSLQMSSSYWTLTSFGFTLVDNDSNVLETKTLSENGGQVFVNMSTVTNSTITMNLLWITNSTQTNATRSWTIYDENLDTDLSIKQFFTDLTTYTNSGMFGLDNFGLAIILFLVIFGFTGIMSWKFGLQSPAAITTLLFTMVLFFDVGLGMLDNLNPVGAVSNFPTIFVGIILIGVLIREGMR